MGSQCLLIIAKYYCHFQTTLQQSVHFIQRHKSLKSPEHGLGMNIGKNLNYS